MITVLNGEGRNDLPATLRHRFENTNWLSNDSFAEFEQDVAASGPCTIFNFEDGNRKLLIVHCHRSEAILVINREGNSAKFRSTTIYPINLGQGAPRYMAFEALTGYLKRSGWLNWNPRLYAHFPLFFVATPMQVDYAMHIEEVDAEDFDPKIYFGDEKPTLRQRWARFCDIAKLYTLNHD